jgi:hypothetical protein
MAYVAAENPNSEYNVAIHLIVLVGEQAVRSKL